jgi:tRNA(Ile2) C34 agmatinyltransferase TiaS
LLERFKQHEIGLIFTMPEQLCPECGATLFYDSPTKRYACKGCGLYVTKDELVNIKDKLRQGTDEYRKRKQQQSEYLEWWLSAKK